MRGNIKVWQALLAAADTAEAPGLVSKLWRTTLLRISANERGVI
jgi:hypothetical protein